MNLFDLLPWWVWLAGGGVIVVLIAMAWALPELAAGIGKAIARLLQALIQTPAGAALVAALVAGGVGYFVGGLRTETICNEAQVRAELGAKLKAEESAHAATRADLEAAKTSVALASSMIRSIDNADQTRQEIIRDGESKPADADCRSLGRAGLEFLRKLGPD